MTGASPGMSLRDNNMLCPLFAPAFAGAILLTLLIRRFIIETPSDMRTLNS